MKITKTSIASGITRTKELPITEEQMQRFLSGEKIQHVFPHLSDSDREFLLTGITDSEWCKIMEDEDNYD